MWEYIVKRVIKEGEYIACHGATVRAAAAHFGISKSTVHKDVTERLEEIDGALYLEVKSVLQKICPNATSAAVRQQSANMRTSKIARRSTRSPCNRQTEMPPAAL